MTHHPFDELCLAIRSHIPMEEDEFRRDIECLIVDWYSENRPEPVVNGFTYLLKFIVNKYDVGAKPWGQNIVGLMRDEDLMTKEERLASEREREDAYRNAEMA